MFKSKKFLSLFKNLSSSFSKKFDYYSALGLDKNCSKADIKKAYAKKA